MHISPTMSPPMSVWKPWLARVWYPRTPFVPQPDALTVIPGATTASTAEIVHEQPQDSAPVSAAPVYATPVAATPMSVPAAHVPAVPEIPRPPAAEPVIAAPPAAAEPIAVPQAAPALKLDWSSGLQQVETRAERVQAAAGAIEDGAPKRVKRVRPPQEPVNQEPLQQVETRNG